MDAEQKAVCEQIERLFDSMQKTTPQQRSALALRSSRAILGAYDGPHRARLEISIMAELMAGLVLARQVAVLTLQRDTLASDGEELKERVRALRSALEAISGVPRNNFQALQQAHPQAAWEIALAALNVDTGKEVEGGAVADPSKLYPSKLSAASLEALATTLAVPFDKMTGNWTEWHLVPAATNDGAPRACLACGGVEPFNGPCPGKRAE